MNSLKKISKVDVLSTLKNFSLIFIGTLILAFGCAVFIVPFDLVTGGVTGLSIVIDNMTGSALPIDITIAILTWALFFFGLFFLGREFAIKTLVSSIVYPVAISLFLRLVEPYVLSGFFYLEGSPHGELPLIIGALFGGLCIGTGCALTFLGGGSTGGLDIVAFILCKMFKKWKSSVIIFLLDAATIILGMFAIGDLVITLLGIISASVGAIVIDRIFSGRAKSFTAQIVSEKYEELNLAIRQEVKRTTTILDVVGGYSGENKKMLMVTFTMPQYSDLLNAINKTDKTAFVSIHRAHEINGEGWTYGEHD